MASRRGFPPPDQTWTQRAAEVLLKIHFSVTLTCHGALSRQNKDYLTQLSNFMLMFCTNGPVDWLRTNLALLRHRQAQSRHYHLSKQGLRANTIPS